MLSQTTEYALRTVVVVARHQNNRVTVRQLAEETAIPQHYLAKVIQLLARARVVNTQRGKGGGITLAQPPAEISVLDIIDVMDPSQPLESCPLKLGEHMNGLCPLHHRINEAILYVRDLFEGTTVADLLRDPRDTNPLCKPAKRKGRRG